MPMEITDDLTIPANVYKVGDVVDEDGCYVCVPCGGKKYLRTGERFPSCLHCMRVKDRKMFKRGQELWERCRP